MSIAEGDVYYHPKPASGLLKSFPAEQKRFFG
jgi:hypothetical protein